MQLSGHLWTAWQAIEWRRRPPTPPTSEAWRQPIDDPLAGSIELNGRLTRGDAAHLVVLVHGLGGCADSHYMHSFAAHAAQSGLSCLRLNLRGADRSGSDFYHAGLSDDLEQALASHSLAGYQHVYIVGFSLGGHLVLRYATHAGDPRLRSVAAVCSPLHLESAAADIDRPSYWAYRRYLFRGLFEMYAAMQPAYPLAHSLDRVMQARTIREWDALTVVPRFGFADVDDYYTRSSVGPRLSELQVPALLLACEADPMVSARSIRQGLTASAPDLRVAWSKRGGHVALPRQFDVGLGVSGCLEAQVLPWLLDPQI